MPGRRRDPIVPPNILRGFDSDGSECSEFKSDSLRAPRMIVASEHFLFATLSMTARKPEVVALAARTA
jgi:hypothetical protein